MNHLTAQEQRRKQSKMEKSSCVRKKWATSMDPRIRVVRRNDDWIIGVGVSLAVMMLFKLTCVILMLL